MSRLLIFFVLFFAFASPRVLFAQDDGPPISITSPDFATTYALASIKSRSLYWSKRDKVLVARVTFTDVTESSGQANDDSHDFRLPGITYNEAKGLFFATTAKGEAIPVAHFKKVLFMKSLETTPNAVIRVIHPKGNVKVILEAISPDDPAMRSAPPDPDSTQKVDIDKILN